MKFYVAIRCTRPEKMFPVPCAECGCALEDHDETGQCGCCNCGWDMNPEGEYVDKWIVSGYNN